MFKHFLRVFFEEAATDGADGGGGGDAATTDNNQESDSLLNSGEQESNSDNARPKWLLDKYVADDKSIEEATAEQAKAYTELQSKFGAFTGAPDDYELAISDELKEAGVEIDSDDPLLKSAMEFAKNANMSNDGFNQMINLYAQQQLAETKALAEYKQEQLTQLGGNAQARIDNISQWANKNLDAETFAGVKSMATSAESIKALEQLIKMTGNSSVDVDESNSNSGVSTEELRAMQFEKDEHGNRRVQTDPEFRKRYQELANKVYGTGEHRVIVG